MATHATKLLALNIIFLRQRFKYFLLLICAVIIIPLRLKKALFIEGLNNLPFRQTIWNGLLYLFVEECPTMNQPT